MAEPELMSRTEVEACLEHAGLRLAPSQIDEIHQVSGHIRQALRRVGAERPMAAEPAHIFKSPVS